MFPEFFYMAEESDLYSELVLWTVTLGDGELCTAEVSTLFIAAAEIIDFELCSTSAE